MAFGIQHTAQHTGGRAACIPSKSNHSTGVAGTDSLPSYHHFNLLLILLLREGVTKAQSRALGG